MADYYLRLCQLSEVSPRQQVFEQLSRAAKTFILDGLTSSEALLAFQALARASLYKLVLCRMTLDPNHFRQYFYRQASLSAIRLEFCNLSLAPARLEEIITSFPSAVSELFILGQCTDNLLLALVKAGRTALKTIAVDGGSFSYRAVKTFAEFCARSRYMSISFARCGINAQAAETLIREANICPGAFLGLYLEGNGLSLEILRYCEEINARGHEATEGTQIHTSATPERLSVKPARKPTKPAAAASSVSKYNSYQVAGPLEGYAVYKQAFDKQSVSSCTQLVYVYKAVMSRSIAEKRQLSAEEFEAMREMFLEMLDSTYQDAQKRAKELTEKRSQAQALGELAEQLSAECEYIWTEFYTQFAKQVSLYTEEIADIQKLAAKGVFLNVEQTYIRERKEEFYAFEAELQDVTRENYALSASLSRIDNELAVLKDAARTTQQRASAAASGSHLTPLQAKQCEQLSKKIAEIYPQIYYLRYQLEDAVRAAE